MCGKVEGRDIGGFVSMGVEVGMNGRFLMVNCVGGRIGEDGVGEGMGEEGRA